MSFIKHRFLSTNNQSTTIQSQNQPPRPLPSMPPDHAPLEIPPEGIYVEYNEPAGNLYIDPETNSLKKKTAFGLDPDKSTWSQLSSEEKVFLVGYFGILSVFIFLYSYKPDNNPQHWGQRVAEERMKQRGVDMYWYYVDDILRQEKAEMAARREERVRKRMEKGAAESITSIPALI